MSTTEPKARGTTPSNWPGVVYGCGLLLAGALACQGATVVYVTDQGRLVGVERPEVHEPVGALVALASPPSEAVAGQVLRSGVLPGTRVLNLRTEGDTLVVEFSRDIIGRGLEEGRLRTVFEQVNATLWSFGLSGSVRLEAEGRLLCDYLKPMPPVEPGPAPKALPRVAGALAGRSIALSPGHGYEWNGSGWVTQRPVYCSPLNQEDFHNLEIMTYLNTYLTQDGAVTKCYRCLDKNYGNHSSGHPWWQMGAYLWLQHQGYPCSVYSYITGDCVTGSGGTEDSDDIDSRPAASNYDNTDIYVSLHTDGVTGHCTGAGCPTGTKTFYDGGSAHAAWATVSQALATDINNGIIAAVQANADPTWGCSLNFGSCVPNANGAYGEIRLPKRAATLTELAFHDTCDRDADATHLRDNYFRSTCMWGMYKGICDYFGVAPTWAFYSAELVSQDIPTSMLPGATATVHITVRNRGVLWNDARQFRLGAVGNADPFTATTRYNVGTEVGPGATRTFTLTLKAPTTPGTYTTDWQMLREGVAWFGPTVTAKVTVAPPVTCSQTNALVGITSQDDGTFTLNFVGTPQAQYYVVAATDLSAPVRWSPLVGSTNTVTNSSGLWSCTVTNLAPQQFYQSVPVSPCP